MDVYSKFDLHIHSSASAKTKSGDKSIVAESNIDNIDVLIKNLICNNVNVVAVTDHNIFDKNIYQELKKQELKMNCIHKVLPGVEIDLQVDGKNVHVVCIFDDESENHVESIEKGFISQDAYSVDQLGAILRKIELSTVLIAHQKCDYTVKKQQKTSLSYLGEENFYKFIGCEFFDALEIQNTKVEGILRSRFAHDNITNINLIVGSDCHEWKYYPAHHSGRYPTELMYMKALPTFIGLVMSITDCSRICKYIEPNKENTLKKMELKIDGAIKEIKLSDNINVIIGDNSVGKSTVIKYFCGMADKGAIDFLNSHGVEIITPSLEKAHYSFSGQGKIREMFESNEEKLPIKEKFKDNFNLIDKKKYYQIIERALRYYKNIWDFNEKKKSNLQTLDRNIYVPKFTEKDKHYLSIELNLNKTNNDYVGLVEIFDEIDTKFIEFNKYAKVDMLKKDDIEQLKRIREELASIRKKYKENSTKTENINELQNVFRYVATLYNDNIAKLSNSDEQSLNTYRNEYNKAIESICIDLQYTLQKRENFWSEFVEFKMEESINRFGKYCFIDKPVNNEVITSASIIAFISKYVDIEKPLEELTTSDVLTSIKSKRVNNESAENIMEFLNIVYNGFIEQFFRTTVEIKKGSDRLEESNSAGINALYYIDILSETYSKPILIIDQPEDDVSQSRIASDLISSLKCLSKKAQIIIVTHNPQLVVNLDVDNVIILKKDENKINFYSGALEYEDTEYSILDLVANTLDGGADVIRKRWKRYAKASL